MAKLEINIVLELHKKWLRGEPDGKRADLTRANLTRADLTRAILTRAILTRANLTGADLTWADLTGADLTRADLTGADLTGADLTGADLAWADLTRANLTGANLTGANLDYSAWPLWCGSLGAKIDPRIFCQLAYHLCRVIVDDQECVEARKALIPLANEFRLVKSGECREIPQAEAATP